MVAALALALGIVTTPDGTPDPSAVVTCADPPSAVVSDGCRRVRCESRRWLPGTAPAGTPCALQPALRLAIELPPQGGGGTLRVTVTPQGAKAAIWRSPEPMPSLRPGRYQVEAARPDGSWRCRTTLSWPKPQPVRVYIPWREPAWVEGRVVDDRGKPRRGVRIHTIGKDDPGWRCEGDAPEVVSGADGSFRVAVDPEAGTLVVAGGWTDPAGIAFGPAVPPLRLVPRLPHFAAARVVDQDGRPASCRAGLDLADEAERRLAPPGEARCDAEGRFTVGPFAAASAAIDLRSVDALPLKVGVAVPPGAQLVDLGEVHVIHGARLRVSVRDDRGHPVEGAAVSAEGRAGLVVAKRASTGTDGAALLTGLPVGGRVGLTVEAPGFARFSKRGVPTDASEEVDLVPVEAIRGRVVDLAGAGVGGSVKVSLRDGTPVDTVATDSDGAFALNTLPEGVVLLRAEAAGFKPSEISRVGDRSREVVLAVREVDELHGSVSDSGGSPIAGASVVLVRDLLGDPPESGALAVTRTGRDGEFQLSASLEPGVRVVATAPGYATAVAVPSSSSLALVLRPEARLLVAAKTRSAITVVDATALPRRRLASGGKTLFDRLAPGSCVVSLGFRREKRVDLVAGTTTEVDFDAAARVSGSVTAGGRRCAQAVVALAVAGASEVGVVGGVRTDINGAYEIEGVAPGAYLVTAVAPEGRAEQRIEVSGAGDVRADLDIVERNIRVLVRRRDEGRPVEGATVTASPAAGPCTAFVEGSGTEGDVGWELAASSGGCLRAETGDDGVVTLPFPQSGRYVVSVSVVGFSRWERPLDVADGTIDVVADLEPGGPPRVRVVIDTLPPLLAGTLYCVHAGGSSSNAPVAGEAYCDGLPPGPAEVAFRADDLALARAAVVVPEAGEVPVTLTVPRAGRLTVPLAGGERTIRILDGQGVVWNLPYGLGWPRCGREGTRDYVCREMPPGTYAVEIDGKRRSPVLVRSGETTVAY